MRSVFALVLLTLLPSLAFAQGRGPSPVRYTEAREYLIKESVRLPGTVDAHLKSDVAGEVGGIVARLHVEDGDAVQKGAPLVELSQESLSLRLDAAKGQLAEAEARRGRAERVLTRAKSLREQNLVSDSDLDEAHSEFGAWEGRVVALKADIAGSEYDRKRCIIRGPFDGVVVARHVETGEWLGAGATAIELYSMHDLEVVVEVPERYFAGLDRKGTCEVTLDSTPGLTLSGKVVAVIPRADARSRTFPVKVRLNNPEGRVAAGMLAQVGLPVGEAVPSVIVPKDALVSQGPGQVVMVMNDDGSTFPANVVPGTGAGAWIAVTGDVAPGMKVITRGNERIFPGMTVAGEPLEYDLP